MSLNTKYRASLVKARVNVPITLLLIYWFCQYRLFLQYQKAGRGLLNLQNLHLNIIGVIINISNSNTVFSFFYIR